MGVSTSVFSKYIALIGLGVSFALASCVTAESEYVPLTDEEIADTLYARKITHDEKIARRLPADCQESSEDNTKPSLVYGPSPRMPQRAFQSGKCSLQFDINSNGLVSAIRPVSCDQVFLSESVIALGRFQFRPPKQSDKPAVFCNIVQSFQFDLLDNEGGKVP